MSQETLFHETSLHENVAALRRDLLAEDGPQISTMRNYRFAILPYRPQLELKLQQLMTSLNGQLAAEGWEVLPISLHKILIDRIRRTGNASVEALIERERRLFQKDPERGLAHLRDKIAPHIEGPEGIAADVANIIDQFADTNRDNANRTVVFIGRAGALHPFFRSSALLKHIDGKTRNIPTVLLYPGERRGNGLSFMCELEPDNDYRPRIYG